MRGRPSLDDRPREFSNQINGTYPEERPLSTAPPIVLAVPPELPEDIQYRVVRRRLILLDMRASVILDQIPYAANRSSPSAPGQRRSSKHATISRSRGLSHMVRPPDQPWTVFRDDAIEEPVRSDFGD